MTDAGHTGTPWRAKEDPLVSERGRVYIEGPLGWDKESVCVCDYSDEGRERDEANAAFIVRAVNAHDDLVAALREIVERDKLGVERGTLAAIASTALKATEGTR